MTATTVTPELRKHFVFLFDLGIEYFNTCIAGDPREAARSLEYDASVYHALHAKLAEVVHSDVELTTDAFTFEGRDLLGLNSSKWAQLTSTTCSKPSPTRSANATPRSSPKTPTPTSNSLRSTPCSSARLTPSHSATETPQRPSGPAQAHPAGPDGTNTNHQRKEPPWTTTPPTDQSGSTQEA